MKVFTTKSFTNFVKKILQLKSTLRVAYFSLTGPFGLRAAVCRPLPYTLHKSVDHTIKIIHNTIYLFSNTIKFFASFFIASYFFNLETARYEFRITPNSGNYDNARDHCAAMGGDLITVNLGPEGSQYHEYVIVYLSSLTHVLDKHRLQKIICYL